MALDKNKILAEATKFVQKGAYDKAIAAYQKVIAHDPKDVRSLLKVAELHQKKGDDKAASQAFQKVAETYADQGFFLKAVAVYKQIVKIDPGEVRVNERLAALYQQLGLMNDAMGQYQLMAAAHEKAGAGAKLTDVLKRMVELDPENIASSIKLGELYARANQIAPALECLRRAADYLKRQNRADEYLKIAERIAALSPDDLTLTREIANIHLAKGDTKRALAKLQLCFKADPKDVETLQLLAQAFRGLGQLSKTISVYKELARVHEEKREGPEAVAVWRKIQELAPDDEDAAFAVGPRAVPLPSPGASAAPGARRPPTSPPRPQPRVPPPLGARSAAAPAAPAGIDAVAKLLSETDVYLKYRLHEKALDHLNKVLAIDPGIPEAHERARDVHLAAGRPEQAAASAARAVRALLARGLQDRARDALARLRELAPGHPELAELNAALSGTDEVEVAEIEGEELVEDGEELVVEEAELTEEPEEDDDALALAAVGDDDDRIVDDPAEAAAIAPEVSADEVEEVPRDATAPPAPEAVDEGDVDLSEEIEEAEFFIQQGLLDEAREALENLLAFYPQQPAVKEKLAEVERRARAATGLAESRGAARGDRSAARQDTSFDIALELAHELGPPAGEAEAEDDFQYSVEEVFSAFKKGVEQTVKREDFATHYDLGIAYREMGLVDDAIHEFEIALEGADRRKQVDCLALIGLCRMAKGEARAAVAAFRRALRSEHLTKEAAKAIQYDLAAAYEEAGDRDAALYYFQRVVKADGKFRDGARRVAALGGGPGRPPTENGPGPRPEGTARSAGTARPAGAPAPGAGRPSAPAGPLPKKNIGYL